LAIDLDRSILISELGNSKIRDVNNWIISTRAGNGDADSYGDGSISTSAALHGPTSVVVDDNGDIYIADTLNFKIRRVVETEQLARQTEPIISTFAGNGVRGEPEDGVVADESVSLGSPEALAMDNSGRLYVADSAARCIYRINTVNNTLEIIAGSGIGPISIDGSVAKGSFIGTPKGVAVDSSTGVVYFSDMVSDTIRAICEPTVEPCLSILAATTGATTDFVASVTTDGFTSTTDASTTSLPTTDASSTTEVITTALSTTGLGSNEILICQ
jgi:streptogramin lyase